MSIQVTSVRAVGTTIVSTLFDSAGRLRDVVSAIEEVVDKPVLVRATDCRWQSVEAVILDCHPDEAILQLGASRRFDFTGCVRNRPVQHWSHIGAGTG